MEALANQKLAQWWEESEEALRDTAEQAVDEVGRGRVGVKPLAKDAVSNAIQAAYDQRVRRKTYTGGWADQSEYLRAYPRTLPLLKKWLSRNVKDHAEPMRDRFTHSV